MKTILQAFAIVAVMSIASNAVLAAESTDPAQHVKKAAVVHHHKKHKHHKKHAAKKAEKKAEDAKPADPTNAEH